MTEPPAAMTRIAIAPAAEVAAGPLELAVIVPTFEERPNVAEVAARVAACLRGIAYELIFVDDDSPDGTADAVRELALTDRRVRCVQRIGRRGLSSACIEGMLASAAPYLAVMDADLQHDETLLPRMLEVMRDGETDVVVGSRYTGGTDVPGWDRRRLAISRLSTWLGQRLLRATVSDPMSGFFMVRRETFHSAVRDLSGMGFKILVDLLASVPEPARLVDLPYRFRERHAGESKLDARAASDFLLLLLDKAIGRWVPARFVLFAAVGGLGVFVHLTALTLLFHTLGLRFIAAQTGATMCAMIFNFAVNNELTFRDRRLSGFRWVTGLASFAIACSVGAVANVGIAAVLYRNDTNWILSALGGILIGAVWNYAVTSFYTWKTPRRA